MSDQMQRGSQLDWEANDASPLCPAPVVDLNVRFTQHSCQHEPGERCSVAEATVCDDLDVILCAHDLELLS